MAGLLDYGREYMPGPDTRSPWDQVRGLLGAARPYAEAVGGLLGYNPEGSAMFEQAAASRAVPVPGAKLADYGATPPEAQRNIGAMMVGMFAGPNAKNAPLEKLSVAQRMASDGVGRDAIWRDTGWFQGADGKWRWEIDDSGARYKPDFEGKTLSAALTHPDIYAAYPAMANIPASHPSPSARFDGTRPYNGLYSPESGIEIHDDLGTKTGRSVVLHEAQHVVQDAEGFGPGGNPSGMAEMLRQEADNRLGQIYAELGKTSRSSPEIQRLFEARNSAKAMKQWDKVDELEAQMLKTPEGSRLLDLDWERANIAARDFSGSEAMDAYKRLAGEVEARAVQARRDLTPAQRAARPPWLDYDVPESQQIVRGLLGSAQNIPVESSALDMSQAARMARAREMGFDVENPQYKAMYPYDYTKETPTSPGPEIDAIKRQSPFPSFGGSDGDVSGIAGFFGQSPDVSNRFAKVFGQPASYKVLTNPGRQHVIDAGGNKAASVQFGEEGRPFRDAIRSGRFDSIMLKNTADEGDVLVMLNPSNIRSVHAAFDPAKRNSADLLASMGGLGLLGAASYPYGDQ